MKIKRPKSKIKIILSFEEAETLCILIGRMSRNNLREYKLTEVQIERILKMYDEFEKLWG